MIAGVEQLLDVQLPPYRGLREPTPDPCRSAFTTNRPWGGPQTGIAAGSLVTQYTLGKDLGAQSLRHVVPDRIFVRELSENGPSVKDLAAGVEEFFSLNVRGSHQPRILTMGTRDAP